MCGCRSRSCESRDGPDRDGLRPCAFRAGARAASDERFGGLTRSQAEEIFGMDTYLGRYGRCEGSETDLTRPEHLQELEEWKLRVDFTD